MCSTYAICRYNDVRRYGIILVAYTISEIEMESQAHSFRMHTRMQSSIYKERDGAGAPLALFNQVQGEQYTALLAITRN